MAKHAKKSVKKKLTKKQLQRRISIGLCAAVALLCILTVAVLFYLDVLPIGYLILVVVALLAATLFCFYSQMRKKLRTAGRTVAAILCAILVIVNFNLLRITSLLGSITNFGYTIETIALAVLKDDPAQTLKDVKDYEVGICDTLDRENVDTAIEKWNKKLKSELDTNEYDGLLHLVEALNDDEIGAIIYNPVHNDMINEDIEGFSDSIRVIDTIEIKVKTDDSLEANHVDVTKEPFVVYISGIDTYGSIKVKSRSDVNMLVYVNPTTKQILLLTTSRDGYVDIPGITTTLKDKLTHAGIYGVEKSIATLEQIYDTEVNYFVRINFTSLIKIIDALGGIDIYCPYSFTAIDGIHFQKGNNHFNGEQALAFARERHAFSEGDNLRGKNQQLVIKAMLSKMMSKSILKGYSSILSTVSDNLQTNMPADQITDLVKMQLSDSSDWNVKSISVDGKGASKCCYSYSATKPLYVSLLSDEKIADAKTEIAKIMNGEILEDTDVVGGEYAELEGTKNPYQTTPQYSNQGTSGSNNNAGGSTGDSGETGTVTSTEDEPQSSSSDTESTSSENETSSGESSDNSSDNQSGLGSSSSDIGSSSDTSTSSDEQSSSVPAVNDGDATSTLEPDVTTTTTEPQSSSSDNDDTSDDDTVDN